MLFVATACGSAEEGSNKRAEAFDQIWSHLDENFYEEEFRGHDWNALGDRYRPLALAAPTDEEFYGEINAMLFELGVSHIAVLPDDHPEWIGAPSAFFAGEVGLDIRIIDDQIVVVHRDSSLGGTAPALKTGTIITRLNGKSMVDFLTEVREPPSPALPELMQVTERAARELFTDPGSEVEVSYLDIDGEENEVTLTAFERAPPEVLLEGVPPVYVDFGSCVIEGNIGYIHFNSFHLTLLEKILAAIEHHNGRPGLIIDLRGNIGGDFNVRRAIAEQLIQERSVVWRYNGRRGLDEIILTPADNAYEGDVVFLVDELSASSAEELSGAMQALGRATVVGTRTAGLVLVADVHRLDIGASLIYPVAETSFVNGYVPEGKGIIPDVEVPWDRSSLREGRDKQLEAALGVLGVAPSRGCSADAGD